MLNAIRDRSNNKEANSFNSFNSLDNFDLRLINDIKQLDDILNKFSRQPISFYINRGLVKLGEQAILFSYIKGGPYRSLSQFIEAAIYDLVKRYVLRQNGVSETFETNILFEHAVSQPTEEKKNGLKCYFCQKSAEKTAIYKLNDKKYPVCLEHAQKVAERPEKWIVEGS